MYKVVVSCYNHYCQWHHIWAWERKSEPHLGSPHVSPLDITAGGCAGGPLHQRFPEGAHCNNLFEGQSVFQCITAYIYGMMLL